MLSALPLLGALVDSPLCVVVSFLRSVGTFSTLLMNLCIATCITSISR